MKWLLISAAAFGLTVATPAMADSGGFRHAVQQDTVQHSQLAQRDGRNDRKGNVRERAVRPRDQRNVRQRPQHFNRQRQVVPRARVETQRRYDWQNYRPGNLPPDWRRHRNFNRHFWQRNFQAERHYRWVPYHRPHGWYYRRWTYGTFFPRPFWVRDYWIESYWDYGLDDPPYGYVWVRYDGDAVFVDVHTGLILRVVYGLYY